MKRIIAAVLYLALSLTAIPLAASDLSEAVALREGDMKKLIFHDTPMAVSKATYDLADDAGSGLSLIHI